MAYIRNDSSRNKTLTGLQQSPPLIQTFCRTPHSSKWTTSGPRGEERHRCFWARWPNAYARIIISKLWDTPLTWMDIWWHKTRLWQQKISGINFLCLSKITYDTKTMMLVSYYQRYWAHIFQNVSHGRDIIHLDNDRAPANNKVIGPAFEKYIDMAILNFCLSWHFQFFQLFSADKS